MLLNTVERKITNKNILFFFATAFLDFVLYIFIKELFRGIQLSYVLFVCKTKMCEVAEVRFLSYRTPVSLVDTENFVAFS